MDMRKEERAGWLQLFGYTHAAFCLQTHLLLLKFGPLLLHCRLSLLS